MNEQQLQALISEVRGLAQYPEVEGETTLEDWIREGDVEGMTAEEIAGEWDELSRQAEENNA